MLDRSIAPPAGEINYHALQQVVHERLANGSPFFHLETGDQPVFKLEIVLAAGSWYETKPSLSWFMAKMLLEGTNSKSGQEISTAFDSLGAFIEITPGFDEVSITIYGINKTFDKVMDLIHEILIESVFSSEALDILKSIRKNQLIINDGKNNMYATKKMREALFGLEHPYGNALTAEDISLIHREDILDYFSKAFLNRPKFYLSGGLNQKMNDKIAHTFGSLQTHNIPENSFQISDSKPEIYVERKDSLQSSLRIAWHIPQKGDDGYFDYLLANTFLGGYFGSRLMKNIREEKGYTYGINSYPIHFQQNSFGVISTDIKANHTLDTLSEISSEISNLAEHGIDEEEIKTVKNYLAGSFLSSINGPFQLMKKFKKIDDYGLTYEYYEEYFDALSQISSEQIQSAILRFFQMNQSHISIVGIKK